MKYDYNSQKIPGVKHVHIPKMLYVPVAGFVTIGPARESLSSLALLKHNETFGPHLHFLINENPVGENTAGNPDSIDLLVCNCLFPPHKT